MTGPGDGALHCQGWRVGKQVDTRKHLEQGWQLAALTGYGAGGPLAL